MVNSIRDKLDESDTVSEIRLLLGTSKTKVCAIVEGEDDVKLFTPLLSKDVDLLQSYSSREGVLEIVRKHFSKNKRVIGIRDRDYKQISKNKRIFYCDYCCAEMMVIGVDRCFERLYLNFYKGSLKSDDLRLDCLKHLEQLSKYRMLSECRNWKIRFDGISPTRLYDDNISQMNMNILSEINRQNPSNPLTAQRQQLCASLPACRSLEELLQITNGHDFVNLFCKMSVNNTSIKAIEATLRGVFGPEEFKQTQLYKDLAAYQQKKKLNILLS